MQYLRHHWPGEYGRMLWCHRITRALESARFEIGVEFQHHWGMLQIE
ncbi:hypothetical protein MIZ03_0774 [Rhodoferax lithotrophicus]|uniref:Uncharacterized protein n=1 Tax=Rhodoferax lithotrophicus TaxID=2798804 RepID=A0ABN6D1I6_9BURK|nr:hypothetical protein MIZ03_0774 [Rhodoferax sp. MIZ03]